MADGAGAGGQRARRRTRVVDGEVAGAFVAGSDRDDHVGAVEVVDRVVEQEGATAVVAGAAEAHVGDLEAVGVGVVQRVEDVLGASRAGLAGEDVVVAEDRPRRDTGRVVRDVDAVDDGWRVGVAGDGAGDVRAVRVDGARVEVVLLDLVA